MCAQKLSSKRLHCILDSSVVIQRKAHFLQFLLRISTVHLAASQERFLVRLRWISNLEWKEHARNAGLLDAIELVNAGD